MLPHGMTRPQYLNVKKPQENYMKLMCKPCVMVNVDAPSGLSMQMGFPLVWLWYKAWFMLCIGTYVSPM